MSYDYNFLIDNFMESTNEENRQKSHAYLHRNAYDISMAVNDYFENDGRTIPIRPPIDRSQDQIVHKQLTDKPADPVPPPFDSGETRLNDLYRAPLDIIFNGTFEQAADFSGICGKYLIVNILDETFTSHTINRDIWSKSSIKRIVANKFLFLQYSSKMEEAITFKNYYHSKFKDFPLIAVLDQRFWRTDIKLRWIDRTHSYDVDSIEEELRRITQDYGANRIRRQKRKDLMEEHGSSSQKYSRVGNQRAVAKVTSKMNELLNRYRVDFKHNEQRIKDSFILKLYLPKESQHIIQFPGQGTISIGNLWYVIHKISGIGIVGQKLFYVKDSVKKSKENDNESLEKSLVNGRNRNKSKKKEVVSKSDQEKSDDNSQLNQKSYEALPTFDDLSFRIHSTLKDTLEKYNIPNRSIIHLTEK
ncbi:hypothetical protein SNEBB_009297 [Seison nebaliae]|nr:hypothetical protein SNEBB_009297 [Seison nebaliae]